MFLESWIVGDKAVNIEGVGFFEATKFKNNYHFSKKSKQKIRSHKNKWHALGIDYELQRFKIRVKLMLVDVCMIVWNNFVYKWYIVIWIAILSSK